MKRMSEHIGLFTSLNCPSHNTLSLYVVSSSMGNGHTLRSERLTSPWLVLTVTTLTWPSFPGWVSTILPVFQQRGWILSSTRSTIAPSRSAAGGVSLCHFPRPCSDVRYSRLHLFQKWARTFSISCHLDNRLIGTSLQSYSGKVVSVSPIRKWNGVRTSRSLGSAVSGVSGLEFKHASIRTKSVYSSFCVKWELPSTFFKWVFTDFMLASHRPPIWGDLAGIKCQFIPISVKLL
jgi:hypothetical protein